MVTLHFVVRNRSAYTLEPAGNFFLSYHARDRAGNMASFDNRRFSLPAAVKPGSTARFALPVYFSLAPGVVPAGMGPGPRGGILGPRQGLAQRRRRAAPAAARRPGVQEPMAADPLCGRPRRGWTAEQYLLRQVFRNNEIRCRGKFFGFRRRQRPIPRSGSATRRPCWATPGSFTRCPTCRACWTAFS